MFALRLFAPIFFLTSPRTINSAFVEAVKNFNSASALTASKRINRIFPRLRNASDSFFRVIFAAFIRRQSRSLLSRRIKPLKLIPPDTPRIAAYSVTFLSGTLFLISGTAHTGAINGTLVVAVVDKNRFAAILTGKFGDRYFIRLIRFGIAIIITLP